MQSAEEIPSARCIMLDISAKQFGELAKEKLSNSYLKKLEKFQSGPGGVLS